MTGRRTFQNRDGVGFCLDVLPQAGADERMAEILQSLYANCPPGAGIQIHLFASPAVRGMLMRYANLRIKDSDHLQKMQAEGRPVRQENIFRALARKRVGFLLAGARKSLTQGFQYTVRDFRLAVSVHLPGRLRDRQARRCFSLRETMITTLNAAAFPSRPFDAADLVAWCAVCATRNASSSMRHRPTYDEGPGALRTDCRFRHHAESAPDGRALRFNQAGMDEATRGPLHAVKTFPSASRCGKWVG
jgi:conjugal transfer ATP-binding protein TraC